MGGVAPPEVAPDPGEPPKSNTEGDGVTRGTGAETESPPVRVEEPSHRRRSVVVGLAVLAVVLAGLGLALFRSRDPSSDPERLKRIEGLIDQLGYSDLITQKERTDAYRILTTEYVSDPRAVERLLARLDESKVGVLLRDERWLKNILLILNNPANSNDAAWTMDSVQKAEAAAVMLDKTQLTQQPTKDAFEQFKRRVPALKKTKAQQ
jgi:hypothetical protein